MNVTAKIGLIAIGDIFTIQRAMALRLRTSTAAERIAKLKKLEAALLAHRKQIYRALMEDLHKPEAEANLAEIMPVISEIRHTARHLRVWMRTRRVAPTMTMLGTQARIVIQPKGATLIIAPWNYPFALTLAPLVSAIAAGNTAIVKPSELSPACSAVMGGMIGEIFDPAEVALLEGGPEIANALLELPFNHIFFTGGPAIGKIVMAAAAKHLSSVTLELGGKSPVIVDAQADIDRSAASIMWGKFLNAGQTCIAPDHLFVHETVLPAFLEASKHALVKMFGDNAQASPNYGRIINSWHTTRIAHLLDDAIANGAQAVTGNIRDEEQKYIAPTLLANVSPDSAVMHEEVFGPVLPVISYTDLSNIIGQINGNPKPMALYVYSKDQAIIDRIILETSSGGACINMSMLHFSHNNLPFGGINNSGIGSAHGVFGFRAFSHERAVLRDRFSVAPMLYPPYTARVHGLIKMTLKYFT